MLDRLLGLGALHLQSVTARRSNAYWGTGGSFHLINVPLHMRFPPRRSFRDPARSVRSSDPGALDLVVPLQGKAVIAMAKGAGGAVLQLGKRLPGRPLTGRLDNRGLALVQVGLVVVEAVGNSTWTPCQAV